MKKLQVLSKILTALIALLLVSTNVSAQCGNLYIAGIIDGPLTGGTPKAIQLCANADIADLSIFGIESVTNGGGSSGTEEYTFPADAVNAGDCIWVTTDLTQFDAYFGFGACYESGVVNANGDDALILYCSGSVSDVFGDPDTDGTGQPWEYTDSWAVSNDMLVNATFDAAEWTFAGPNALDGEATNTGAANPYPNATANCPPTVIMGCMDMNACNYDPTATMDDGSCFNIDDVCDDNNAATTNDVYTDCMTCAGTCPMGGVPGGTCDDGDPMTTNDVILQDCTCVGTPPPSPECGNLYIAGIIDGPLAGGTPKGIQLCANAAITDLSIFGIESITNGNGSSGTEEYTFPPDALDAGDCIWVTTDPTQFTAFFGFDACYQNSVIGVNGDDPIILYCSSAVSDVFGDPNTDGTGEPWEYTDSWAVSDDMVVNATFDPAEWTFAGPDAIEGETTNAGATNPYPNAMADCPLASIMGCTDMTACNYNPDATIENGSCFAEGDACNDNDDTTTGDTVQADCSCVGVPFDCPAILADIGDDCDDGNVMTGGDEVQMDCTCMGTPLVASDIYIAELSFDPCAEQGTDGDCEYIIITNAGATDVDISNYSFDNGITYTFPAGTILPAGDSLSIGASADCIGLDDFDLVAFSGGFSNSTDETIEVLDAQCSTVSSVTYDSSLGDGDCNANCFDEFGIVSECSSSLYDPMFDCPDDMTNFGDACDDGDANTTNDIIQSDCNCAGTVPTPADIYISELSFNPCPDQGSDTDCEYLIITNTSAADVDISDYTLANGITFTFPMGTILAAGDSLSVGTSADCTGLDAFDLTAFAGGFGNSTNETVEILDASGVLISAVTYDNSFGNGNCDVNCFDAIGTPSECPSSLYNPMFDCVDEMVDFGDECDDGDANTTNDLIQADCSCAGTIPVFDCPTEMLNFGDACDDGNANTVNDVVLMDCSCVGTALANIYISELSFNPCDDQGSDCDCEYLIIANGGATDADISGYEIDNGVTFTFPSGTIITAGGMLSVGATENCTGLDAFDLTGLDGSFNDMASETVEIIEPEGSLISLATYDTAFGDGDCNANCFDDAGVPFDCVSSLYNEATNCSLVAGSCNVCPLDNNNIAIDLTTGGAFNDGAELCAAFDCFNPIDPAPTYDNSTNTGTWTLPAGLINAFAVGGVENLSLPNVINGGCLTADINVISGTTPFLIEFRIENGTGAPGDGGEALTFNVMVDGEGTCSMGGDFSTGIPVNSFTFVPGAAYSVAVALADFSGSPVPSDIIIEVSNIALNVCAPNVMGCTDPNACNFDATATIDDDSCILATGCDVCDGAGGVTDNLESGEPCDDGDPATINDTVQADCSCAGVLPDEGCTDPNATNYDDMAMTDNGTCLYLCDDAATDLLPISTDTPFNSSEFAYALQSGMGLLAGANDDFAGFIWDINTTGLTNDEFCISIDYTVTGDAIVFPITLEFRIENIACGFDPCPSTNFNLVVNGPGTYTLGSTVSSGTAGANGPFDPTGSAAVVAAIANFSGTPLGADIIIEFGNLCVSTNCAIDIPGCMDNTACNFDPLATSDDGSCIFATGCDVCDGMDGVTDNPDAGESCDDGDPNTTNDTIQADCSCAGIVLPPDCTPSIIQFPANPDGN